MLLNLFTDGGARGNPGPAACGWIAFNSTHEVEDLGGEYLGDKTNNYAEYSALKLALTKFSRQSNASTLEISCHLDSELVVKQLQGLYKIKEPQLAKLAIEVKSLVTKFGKISFTHVPREENKAADRIVNLILDTKLTLN